MIRWAGPVVECEEANGALQCRLVAHDRRVVAELAVLAASPAACTRLRHLIEIFPSSRF